MTRAVPDTGPYDARLLLVGEAGGKNEGQRGEPFVGRTGEALRRGIEHCGLSWDHDVRRANVIPFEMPTLPKTLGGLQAVIRDNWEALTPTLVRGSHKAVLAVGRAALWRLTGRARIKAEAGGVFIVDVGGRMVPLVACIHPASVMRTKLGVEWLLVNKAIERACAYANGATFEPDAMFPAWQYVNDAELDAAMSAANERFTIDTEFSIETGAPFLIGVSVDGGPVMSVRPTRPVIRVLQHHLSRTDIVKTFHHNNADVGSLSTLNIDVTPPIADTLLAHATCYPDLPLGLSKVTLFHLDGYRDWKDMDHSDPGYNAIDVRATDEVWLRQRNDLSAMGLWDVYEDEVLPASALTMAMEARGMRVDPSEQARMIEHFEQEKTTNEAMVLEKIGGMFAKRRTPLLARVAEIDKLIVAHESTTITLETCPVPKHDTYTGVRGKKFSSDPDCICASIRSRFLTLSGGKLKELKTERTKTRNKLASWDRSFDLGNSHDCKWLFYDKDGLGLPPQRNKDGNLTTNSDAVARLLSNTKVNEKPDAVDILRGIKAYQHADKMISTFCQPPVDGYGLAHPEYRVFGTGTGRPAGGSDGDLSDKRASEYAFNALNIPKEVRSIFVPREVLTVPTFHVPNAEVDDEDDETVAEGEES